MNDKTRFDQFLKILSETFVDHLIKEELFNAEYDVNENGILDQYSNYKQQILARFEGSKINKAYENFNTSFDTLKVFLRDHFWIPDDHYRMHKDPHIAYLEPRIHHNFGGANKNPQEWDALKRELEAICDDFLKNYKKFLKVAKKEIEKQNSNKKLWIFGITATAIITAIVTILVTKFSDNLPQIYHWLVNFISPILHKIEAK